MNGQGNSAHPEGPTPAVCKEEARMTGTREKGTSGVEVREEERHPKQHAVSKT